MTRIAEIDAQMAKLQAERDEEVKASRAAALVDVKAKIKDYKFTPTELKGVLKARRKKTPKSNTTVVNAKPAVKKPRAAKSAKQGPKQGPNKSAR